MFRSLPRSRFLKQEAVPIIVSKTPKQIPKVGLPSSATAGNNMQPDGTKHSKMSSAIERPFIETRSHNDRPMNVFLSDSDGFSSGIAPKCLIGHRSADHRYRMSFAGRYDRKSSSVVSWR
ncbi:hypothetical protein AVEN_17525-1 [Araneus ventricosus]|uniref:Uncharacterized protein n=1 Tax=Araneus ventricosus TaxID=182803 RepID=A0A4Y2HF62_ARAVE|nr:hypothetical protein AVEN_17525-1 [Araneus ventricosus]